MYYIHTYIHEGRDEAMASRGQILETKKQPEIVLLKYFYFPPENLPSRCHGFIPTFMYVCMYVLYVYTYTYVQWQFYSFNTKTLLPLSFLL